MYEFVIITQKGGSMQFRNEDKIVVLHLQEGEELIKSIADFAKANGIEGGLVQGIGTTTRVKIGYYNESHSSYDILEFDEPMELLSAMGSISMNDSEVVVHLHGSFADDEFSVLGGHIIEAEIFATGEFFITKTGRIDRKHNEKFKLNLFDI